MGKKKKSNYFKENLHNIINSVGIIIALIISIYSYNQNEKIAIKSGAYDKGSLSFLFGNYPIVPEMKYDVYFGVNLNEKDLNFTNLPVGIINTGKKTVEEVSLFYRYPNATQIAVPDSLFEIKTVLIENLKRKFEKADKFDNISFNVGKMNPNLPINAGDLIFLNKETKQNFTFPVKTKDSVTVIAKTEVSYSFPFNIMLTGKDIESTNYSFNLNIRNEVQLNKLIKQIINEKLQEKKKGITNPTFFVTIPSIEKKQNGINIHNSDSSNTLLIQFDKEFENYIIYNSNGEINKVFSI